MNIPRHEFRCEGRREMRHTSALNMDYADTVTYLMCSCGWEKALHMGESSEARRLTELEHVVEVLARGC